MSNEFKLEEFKQVRVRQDLHEGRYFSQLTFTATTLSAVIGFSEKIPNYLIPIIVVLILVITTHIALTNLKLQAFTSAYLLEYFNESEPDLNFEKAFYSIHNHDTSADISSIKKIKSIIGNPFSLLNTIGAAISVNFIYILQTGHILSNIYVYYLYIGFVAASHLYVYSLVYRYKNEDYSYYINKVREWKN